MASIVRGLASLEGYLDKANAPFDDSPKARWVKLDDGQTVKINFLQEIDADSPNYSEKAGTTFLAVEHSNPDDYRRKALCTLEDEGSCYGCEQARAHPKTGWRSRGRLYANVLVDDGKDTPYVAILSQGTSGKSITPTLVMFASDAGGITGSAFRIKRSGTGTATEYSLVPIMKSEGVNPDEYDLFDLEKVCTRYVPYAEQKAFYGVVEEEVESFPDSAPAASAMEW